MLRVHLLSWGCVRPNLKDEKHINIYLTALAGQSSQGQTPTRPKRDKRDKIPILLSNSTENGRFVPGTGPGLSHLVAFHPRPQIASDLGRNVTRSFNPHRNRNQFPSGNEILAYGRRFKSQPASTRCDLRIASPTRPFLQVI